MTGLIDDFQKLSTDVPKKTNAIQHDVDVGETRPHKQRPYQVNPLRVKHVKSEIKYMLEHDMIEPSKSKWRLAMHLSAKT